MWEEVSEAWVDFRREREVVREALAVARPWDSSCFATSEESYVLRAVNFPWISGRQSASKDSRGRWGDSLPTSFSPTSS